jgi:hypothetical protein
MQPGARDNHTQKARRKTSVIASSEELRQKMGKRNPLI